jgi:hypothetical protein
MQAVPKIDVKGILKQLQRTPQDPWDWRPGPECFSIRDVVNIFRSGANEVNMYHLSRCERDRTWIANYAQMAFPLPVTEVGVWKNIANWFGASQTELLARTPLYVLGKNVEIEKVETAVSIEIALVGGLPVNAEGTFAGPTEIDLGSVKLEGALCARGATTVERRLIEPNLECLVIRFDNARLAGAPRKGIVEHKAVQDSVMLSGRLSVGGKETFRGQADIQLVRTATCR